MPTLLPQRAPDTTRTARLLSIVAISLAMAVLIEMTIQTPPLASEFLSTSLMEATRF